MALSEDAKLLAKKVLEDITPLLDENIKRVVCASFARALGHGGIAYVNEITNSARNTIKAGIKELNDGDIDTTRIRKEGGGRKKEIVKNPLLLEKIEDIIRDNTYGNPMKVITWTTLSLRKIANKLQEFGIKVSQNIVSRSLTILGYSKQQNKKMEGTGSNHPDRDKQFNYINQKAEEFIQSGDPVISIDTKKKENLGNFKNAGREYREINDPRIVKDHDFLDKELGKVVPYGIYVLNDNTGFVNLGVDHDTADFAAESIYRWWDNVGSKTFSSSNKIYINCDSGGSNSSRTWLFKAALQNFSNKTGLEVHVSHLPPGTSKWNKIEHRLFCYITKSWEGKPLYDIQTVINLISATTTTKGLKVKCIPDYNTYETGLKMSEEEKEKINITFTGPNERWNYIIKPSL